MAQEGAQRSAPVSARDRGLPRQFILAGLLLGIGLGGFVDGILLHQILQWHHMLTATHYHANTVSGLETNTLWDGFFHAFTWFATAAGLYLLWDATPIQRPDWGRALFGLLLAGWGLFNLVEGLIDHQILGIHHVRDDVGTKWPWDLGFLVLGALLLAGGWQIVRRALAQRGPEEGR